MIARNVSKMLFMSAFSLVGVAGGLLSFVSPTLAGPFAFCPGDQAYEKELYYYIQAEKCWKLIKHDDKIQLGNRGAALPMVFLFSSFANGDTAVVLKQRDYLPSEVVDAQGKKIIAKSATQTVVIERPRIAGNPCGNKEALNASIRQRPIELIESGEETLNAFNRYHAQPSYYIPGSSQLRRFHFSYQLAEGGCRATDDLESRNRAQYVFENFETKNDDWFGGLFGQQYSNDRYALLKVRHVFSSGQLRSEADTPEGYRAIQFKIAAYPGRRTELSILDLKNRFFNQFFPDAWTIDWTQ